MTEENKTGHLMRTVLIVVVAAAVIGVLAWWFSTQFRAEVPQQGESLQITQIAKTSTTLRWESLEDYLLSWTIKVTIDNNGDDVEAGRTRLAVNLYDSNGRYDTKQVDDLGPLTSGWGGDYSVIFLVDQGYGPDGMYAEVTLYLDGEQVDTAVAHF